MKYTIDATNRAIGRIASEAALVLRGKNSADFAPHKASTNSVAIVNASKVKLSEKKRRDTKFVDYSGYPGGRIDKKLKDIIAKHGMSEPIRAAVYGMIPNNKLRPGVMKRLSISE